MEIDREQLLARLRESTRPERIVMLRALYSLSQEGLASIADVARTTVSTWETPLEQETGRSHEPGKLARQRMGTFFNLPAYVFSDEWGKEPEYAKSRRRKSPPEEPTIRVPAPNQPAVKRIGNHREKSA